MLNSTFCKYPFNMSASAIYGSICKNTWVERPRIRTTQSDYSVNMQKPYGKMWDSLCFCLLPKWSKKPLFFLRQFCVKFAQVERNLNAIWTQSERNLNAIRTLFVFLRPQHGYSCPITDPPKVVKSTPPKKREDLGSNPWNPKALLTQMEKNNEKHIWVSIGFHVVMFPFNLKLYVYTFLSQPFWSNLGGPLKLEVLFSSTSRPFLPTQNLFFGGKCLLPSGWYFQVAIATQIPDARE